jgi:ABC-type glycerol-3-phosphate transport system substrate-binding protein
LLHCHPAVTPPGYHNRKGESLVTFKHRIPTLLNIVLILALLLTGCGKGVLDVQIVPPEPAAQSEATLEPGAGATTSLAPVMSGLPGDVLAQIQPIALSFLAGSAEDRQPFLQYQTTPCSNQPSSGQPPCSPGESEGQALQVFPLGAGQPAYLRLEDIRRRLDFQVKDLYAVYRFPAEQNNLPPEQRGEYGLLFDREASGQPEPVLAVVTSGRLVRLEFYPGVNADEVLNRIPVSQVILPPQQARLWSEPLQQLQLQSQTEISPDRRWNTQTTLALPAQTGQLYYRRLTVTSQDSSQSYTLVDEWAEFGAGYSAPRPLSWFGMSPTEFPVLYWSYVPVVDSCQTFYNGSDLHRLDLQNGISQTLLTSVGTWLAVSPDQSRAAAVDGTRLGIYDLSSGQGRFMELPGGQASQAIWSPDGREVALTIADESVGSGSACAAAQSATHTILRVDADTLEIRLRLTHEPRRLVTQSWSQLGLIKLTDPEAKAWLLDPQTGEVWDPILGRPTPTAQIGVPAQIRFYANLYEADVVALSKLAEQFAAENPGMQVTFPDVNNRPQVNIYDNDMENYQASLVSGADCFVDWSMPREYNRRSELLLDLSPLLAVQGADLSRDYWPEQLDGYRLDGRLYGLPMFERPSMIYFNADLLAQKKLSPPATDWTFDDLATLLAEVSSEQFGERVYGFSADAGSLGEFLEGLFSPIFDLSTNPPTARFVSPEMAAGLERIAELRRSGAIVYIPATLYAGQDYYDAADAWLAGRLALWQMPYGEATPFPAVEQLPAFQMGMAPLPAHGPIFRNGYSVQQSFYIGKDSPNAVACLEWYRYVTEHPEEMSSAPARRSMIGNAAWRAQVGEANAVALQTAIERVYTEPPRFSDQMNPTDPLISWLAYAVTDYLNGADAQLVMVAAQAKADAYTACLLPQLSLEGTVSGDAILTCLRQVDPGRW